MATRTMTTTPQEDARMVTAFGAFLNLGRDATQEEITANLVTYINNVTFDQEAKVDDQHARDLARARRIKPT